MSHAKFEFSMVENDVVRLATLFSIIVRPGDMIALRGDLGAGKTTFARALIRHLLGDAAAEVPSPSFSLLQTYTAPRMEIAHADFYRLDDPAEISELGLDDMSTTALTLIEWPGQGEDALLPDRFEVQFGDDREPDHRNVLLLGMGTAAPRLTRLMEVRSFICRAGWGDAVCTFMQGDASTRMYARLYRDGESAVLMDSPRQPDGPAIHDGKAYSQVAHLAEDVRPFVAVADALRESGLATPLIHACDIPRGLLLIEDFGEKVLGDLVRAGQNMEQLWRAAVDVLAKLRTAPPPASLPVRTDAPHTLPTYDRDALEIELSLLADWYWPLVNKSKIPPAIRDVFEEAWQPVLDRLLKQPSAWVLRDFHSPNLMWLEGRADGACIGLLDFQDALCGPAAYDLVSLLQDARIDVAPDLEERLFDYYGSKAQADPTFDREEFAFAYAAVGAQRNSKILGIFARLSGRDGKPQYLRHLPRIWGYLERDLAHAELADLRNWYDNHFPVAERRLQIASSA